MLLLGWVSHRLRQQHWKIVPSGKSLSCFSYFINMPYTCLFLFICMYCLLLKDGCKLFYLSFLFKLALKQNSYNFRQLGASAKTYTLVSILDLCLQFDQFIWQKKKKKKLDIFSLDDQFVLLSNVHHISSATNLSLLIAIWKKYIYKCTFNCIITQSIK